MDFGFELEDRQGEVGALWKRRGRTLVLFRSARTAPAVKQPGDICPQQVGVVGRAGCHRALSRFGRWEKCMGPWVICRRLGWQMATVMDSAVVLVAFHGADRGDPWSLRESCVLIGPEIKAVQTGCFTFATK
jgi:hypothetical protein